MKKFMMTLAAVLCCAMSNIVFTSCGSDDDNNTSKPSETTAEIKGIAARYYISVDENMAKLCDYTMTFYGINGELTTEQATWTIKNGTATWIKDVTNTHFPATFGLKISVKVKEGAQLEGVFINDVYLVSNLLYIQGVTVDAKKTWDRTIDFTGSASTHFSTSGEHLPTSIAAIEHHGGLLNKSYTFDKDGNLVNAGKIE